MNMAKPVIRQKIWLSGIWLLPLLSALVGGWMLYQSMIEKGIEISILFDNASGIRAGKTAIIYKGVRVGVVREVHISKNMQQVKVIVEIQRAAKEGLRNTTGFWLVKPKVSLTEITGLETIVSGNYIRMKPGKGKSQREFIALEKAPILDDYSNGLYINILADHLGSVARGSKIYFREIPVGEVLDYELAEALNGVVIKARIDQHYAHLVKKSSRFWNASGLSIKAGLTGFSMHTESLAALITGGIAFYTPDTDSTDSATNDTRFKLHNDFDNAKVGIPVKINFASAIGLEEDVTEVRYDAFKIGIVKKLSYQKNGESVIAEVMFDPRAAELLKAETKFWLDKPKLSLTDFSGIKSLLQGNHIKMQVGGGPDLREFIALRKPPLLEAGDKGLHIQLKADTLGSIEFASPVLYKKIQVGQVHDFKLDKKGEYVLIDVYITERYAHLVASNSRFWNASGVQVKLDTNGMDIHTGTLNTMLNGGIAFITPALKHKKVKNGTSYPLYKSYDAIAELGIESYKQEKDSRIIQISCEQLGSLAIGSKIYYKKIPVGKIVHYRLNAKDDTITIFVAVRNKYQHLVSAKSRFWRNSGVQVKAGLSGIDINMASVHALLNGGISFANIASQTAQSSQNLTLHKLYADRQQALQKVKDIQITFALAKGITVGTAIKYLGIQVGEVTQVELSGNNQAIIAYAKLWDSATEFARQGSRFWLISAQLGLFKSAHLETLLKGNYLQIEPGSGKQQTQFKGELSLPREMQGLHIVLKSPSLGSIKVGNSVSYRQIPVGEVRGYQLSHNAQYVLIDVFIAKKYANLVKSNTKFWHASGVQIDFDLLTGAEVRTESVENLVLGGIAFATPEGKVSNTAKDGQIFNIYPAHEQEWLDWTPEITVLN